MRELTQNCGYPILITRLPLRLTAVVHSRLLWPLPYFCLPETSCRRSTNSDYQRLDTVVRPSTLLPYTPSRQPVRLSLMCMLFINSHLSEQQPDTMSSSQQIAFHALSSQEDQIRTLILQAGKVHEPIECSLRTISLATEASYDALSYVWGDAMHYRANTG